MSTEARLETLHRMHGELESELREALAHPAFDETKVHDLKLRKLRLKDEIERLKATGTKAAK